MGILSLLRSVSSIFSREASGRAMKQAGATILPLALAGLLGTSAIAVPLLNRSISSVESASRTSPVQGINAEAAAWYAMWRLEHDPTIHDEFTGSPPTTMFSFRGSEITVVGIEPPDNSGIIMSMTATPNSALPETPTVIDYTLTVKNDDDQPHDILRIQADAAGSYNPTYVASSTTGMTTVEPTQQANRFTWTPVSPITIDPLGAELTLSWQMTVDEEEGNYWMDGEVRIDGVGDIEGLTEANVLVAPPNDVLVTVAVTPPQVDAGENTTFTYTITMENVGSSDFTLTDIKFWTTKALEVDLGSSSGVSVLDPSRNSDMMSNDRWEWTWNSLSVPFEDGDVLTQTFTATGSLTPGTWFAEGAVKTQESNANGQEVAATSSAAAPVKAVRVYDIHVEHGNSTLDVEALLDNSGVQPISWIES